MPYRTSRQRKRRRKALLRQSILALAALTLVGGVGLGVSALIRAGRAPEPVMGAELLALPDFSTLSVPQTAPALPEEPEQSPPADGPEMALVGEEVNSQSCAVFCVEDGILTAAKAPDEAIYPASMTKVMTLLTAAELADDLDAPFTMTQEILDPLYREGATLTGVAAGESLTLREYCYAAALRSAGDATGAVAESLCGSERAFVERMNEKARQLGLSEKTHFANTSGLFAADNTCTARDMAAIMAAAMEEALCREVLSTVDHTTAATESQPEGIVLRNKYLDWFQEKQPEGFTVTACKNGYIRQSKNCLVSYGTGASGKHYICVTAGAGTAVQLMQDHRLLLSTYGK